MMHGHANVKPNATVRSYLLSRNVIFVLILILHEEWKKLEGFHNKLMLSALKYVTKTRFVTP